MWGLNPSVYRTGTMAALKARSRTSIVLRWERYLASPSFSNVKRTLRAVAATGAAAPPTERRSRSGGRSGEAYIRYAAPFAFSE